MTAWGDIKRRIQLATGTYSGLKIIWKDNNIRLETKVHAATSNMCVLRAA